MKPDPDKHCTYASLSSSRQRTGGIKYESIDWALDSSPATVQYVGVHHSRGDIGMPQQLLNRPNVIAIFQ